MVGLERLLARLEAAVAVAALAAMVLLSFVEILARNLFDTGLPGVDLLLRYLVLVVSLLGAVLAVRERRHIRLDAAVGLIPESWTRPLRVGFDVLSALVCGTLAWEAVRYWLETWRYAGFDRHWLAALSGILPLSLMLLAVHFLLRAWIGARPPESVPEPES